MSFCKPVTSFTKSRVPVASIGAVDLLLICRFAFPHLASQVGQKPDGATELKHC